MHVIHFVWSINLHVMSNVCLVVDLPEGTGYDLAEFCNGPVQAERQRLASIPGMLHPHEAAQEETMAD